VISISAAFQLPNNGGFAEKRRNTQKLQAVKKQCAEDVPKLSDIP
jgi:hypothetical protein